MHTRPHVWQKWCISWLSRAQLYRWHHGSIPAAVITYLGHSHPGVTHMQGFYIYIHNTSTACYSYTWNYRYNTEDRDASRGRSRGSKDGSLVIGAGRVIKLRRLDCVPVLSVLMPWVSGDMQRTMTRRKRPAAMPCKSTRRIIYRWYGRLPTHYFSSHVISGPSSQCHDYT